MRIRTLQLPDNKWHIVANIYFYIIKRNHYFGGRQYRRISVPTYRMGAGTARRYFREKQIRLDDVR